MGLTPICVFFSPISFCRAIVLSCLRAILPSCYLAFVVFGGDSSFILFLAPQKKN